MNAANSHPPIHVAGIMDSAEAEMLIDRRVRYLGFPLVLGYHREDLSVDAAAAIVAKLGGRAAFFLITYLDTAAEIRALCRTLGVGTVQLHGHVDLAETRRLRQMAPGLRIIKSLIVRGGNAELLAREAGDFAPWVDAYITDTFDPATGATGATGKTHDWTVSQYLAATLAKPVILAGGLHAGNVRDAILRAKPAGVDVHTGIEGPDGRKRHDLTERFIAEASAGFTAIGGSSRSMPGRPCG